MVELGISLWSSIIYPAWPSVTHATLQDCTSKQQVTFCFFFFFFWPNGYLDSAKIQLLTSKTSRLRYTCLTWLGLNGYRLFFLSARKFMFRVSHLDDVTQHLKVKSPMVYLPHTSRSQSTGDFTHLRHTCSLRLETYHARFRRIAS